MPPCNTVVLKITKLQSYKDTMVRDEDNFLTVVGTNDCLSLSVLVLGSIKRLDLSETSELYILKRGWSGSFKILLAFLNDKESNRSSNDGNSFPIILRADMILLSQTIAMLCNLYIR